MRLLILAASTVILLMAPPAWACSCLRQSPEAFAAEISLLFDGALIGTEPLSPEQQAACAANRQRTCFAPIVGTFRVGAAYKGDLGAEIRVLFRPGSSSACGIDFELGKSVTIAARGDAATGWVVVRSVLRRPLLGALRGE